MIDKIILELGPWNWMVLGIVLLGAEILLPGVFLIWIGLAAIVTGVLALVMWDLAFFGWQIQMLIFLALALGFAWFGKRYMDQRSHETDEPELNLRTRQLIGRVTTLEEPLLNGQGRIRLGDTWWLASGQDMQTGTRVRVTGEKNGVLQIEADL